MTPSPLRAIPSVDRLLGDPDITELLEHYPRPAVLEELRGALNSVRTRLVEGHAAPADVRASVVEDCRRGLAERFSPGLRRVVNATGVVLHTNLGRAPLASAVRDRLDELARGYSNLEYDLASGQRGHRATNVEGRLRELSGAEAACVVNNNAASVLLILQTLASGREVIVSRGELIEIGGAFRLPDVLRQSGATLVEVGTTNKTYLSDYEQALSERTGLLLKSHTSNYRIEGFTHEVSCAELAALGRAHGVPTCIDLGSGVLVDLERWGLPHEPTVAECVASGLDLVCFSGDKLLGGPQAGIIVGREELVSRCAAHPLMRALRCDKLILGALEVTLDLYRQERYDEVPVLQMLSRPNDELEKRMVALCHALYEVIPDDQGSVQGEAGESLPGGGSLPGCRLKTWVVSVIRHAGNEREWAEGLRGADPPVICRVEEGKLVFDVRTLREDDVDAIVGAFRRLFS